MPPLPFSQPSSATSDASLDSAPPHMAPRRAGDDTRSLLGDRPDSDLSSGEFEMSPMGNIIAGIASLLDGVNRIQSVMPGALSPQFLMEVEQLTTTLPEAAQQLTQMSSPMSMLSSASAMAPRGMGSPQSSPGMGGLPMMPSAQQSAGMPSSGGFPQR